MSTENTSQERDVQAAEDDTQNTAPDSTAETGSDQQTDEQVVKDAKSRGVDMEEFERTKKALAKANREAQERRHKLAEYEELGVDPDTVKKWKADMQAAEEKRKREEGRYEELIQELRQDTESEKERIRREAEEQVGNMRKSLEEYFVNGAVESAIAKEGASSKLLSKHVKEQVRVVEEDGKYRAVVVDAEGNPRTKRGGHDFTINDLLEEMKQDDDFSRAFPAPKVSGSGSTSGTADKPTGKQAPIKKRSEMKPAEQREFVAKYGIEEYKKLPR